MENPASWDDTTSAIQQVINDHETAQNAGAIGGSLAMHIQTVVVDPLIRRIADHAAEVETSSRAIKYRGSLLEEALIHLEECDAWQLRESIKKELVRTDQQLQPKGEQG